MTLFTDDAKTVSGVSIDQKPLFYLVEYLSSDR